MAGPQRRTITFAIAGVVLAWALALGGYELAKNAKATPEKIMAFARSLDLSKMSAADRAKALRKLADELNGLSPEERRLVRPDKALFSQMTEPEQEQFIENTMPMQVKQALSMYEHMSADQRQKAIDTTLSSLRARAADNPDDAANANPTPISPELEAKIRTVGLKTFYSESSAETKAELAPLLNELQIQMQTNRAFRRAANGN